MPNLCRPKGVTDSCLNRPYVSVVAGLTGLPLTGIRKASHVGSMSRTVNMGDTDRLNLRRLGRARFLNTTENT
jgi:hypothetical protein